MSEEIYTVEQFAERLKLHPKTVLRFIREGRIRAVKVGRSYRILRSNLEAFGLAPSASERSQARATSIVDVPNLAPQQAQDLARIVTSAGLGRQRGDHPLSIDVAHDPTLRQAKVVVVGATADVAAMLRIVDVWLEQMK